MATVGRLAAEWGVKMESLRRGLRDSQSAVRRMTRNVNRFGRGMGKAFGGVTRRVLSLKAALLGLLGAGGFGLLLKQSLDAIDRIGKLSTRLGVSTQSLSEYRLAAELGGLSTEQFTMALQRMSRRIGQASEDSGEAQDALRQLGLEADKLVKLPLDQQLEAVADALSQVENANLRAARAQKLFDSEGVALLQIVADGAEGIRRLREEARLLGLSLSAGAVRGVESANDSLSRLRLLIVGLRDQFTAALAPAIEEVVSAFRNWILATAQARGGVRNFARELAVKFLGLIRDIGVSILNLQERVSNAFASIGQAWRDLPFTRGTEEVRAEIAKVREEMERLGAGTATFGPVAEKFENARLRLEGLKAELEAMEPTFTDNKLAIEAWTQTMNNLIATAQRGQSAVAGVNRAIVGGGGENGEGDGLGMTEREKLGERMEAIREFIMTREETERLAHERRMETLRNAWEEGIIPSEARFRSIVERLEAKHGKRMREIRQRDLHWMEKFLQQSLVNQVKMATGGAAQMTSVMATHSKRWFKINKAFALANAIVSTAQGVAQALRDVPFPANLAAAAVIGAKGALQIAAIRATQFSGGGVSGGAAASVAASAPATPVTPVESTAQSQDRQVPREAVIQIQGRRTRFSRDEVEELIEQINELSGDGLRIRVAS